MKYMTFHLFPLLVIQSFLWKQVLGCGLIKSPGLLEHCGASVIDRNVLQCFLAGFLPHPLMQISTVQFNFKQSNWLTSDENLLCSILTSWKTASNSSLSDCQPTQRLSVGKAEYNKLYIDVFCNLENVWLLLIWAENLMLNVLKLLTVCFNLSIALSLL